MFSFFFFNDTATTEIYTLSLHDALPISATPASSPTRSGATAPPTSARRPPPVRAVVARPDRPVADEPRTRAPLPGRPRAGADRKSTRLNSSHANISYAVFCLKKKKTDQH